MEPDVVSGMRSSRPPAAAFAATEMEDVLVVCVELDFSLVAVVLAALLVMVSVPEASDPVAVSLAFESSDLSEADLLSLLAVAAAEASEETRVASAVVEPEVKMSVHADQDRRE